MSNVSHIPPLIPGPRRKSRAAKIVILILGILVGCGLLGIIGIVVLAHTNTRAGTFISDALSTIRGGAALPADFPSDVPVYPGSHLDVARHNSRSSLPEDFVIAFRSGDALATIEAFYESHLSAFGFTVSSTPASGKVNVVAKKADRIVAVVIKEGPEGDRIVSIAQIHAGFLIR